MPSSNRSRLPRRPLLLAAFALLTAPTLAADFAVAPFTADVTIPIGHPCMGGGITPATRVAEPLWAKGFVLLGGDKPFVVVTFDWCEIRGSAYDDWRAALAEEAGTEPQRVMITSTHAHDAPVMDPEAEFLLSETERSGAWKSLAAPPAAAPIQIASVCWPDFNRLCIQRVRAAMRAALSRRQPVTHLGLGRAQVREVASNRRFVRPDGSISYGRMSFCADRPDALEAPEGDIDPWLRTISFWNGDTAICALSSYAVHPMSRYGRGEVSPDFVGFARDAFEKETPGTLQLYASGCAGNVTAGKYNDGNRTRLADKLLAAMRESWRATQKHPFDRATFRLSRIPLGARELPGYTTEILHERMRTDPKPSARAHTAMGLAWYGRVAAGHRIDLPLLDFGPAQLLLLPAESYVEYQIHAQSLRPDSFVLVMGYGECGPGYIPIERAWQEQDTNLHDWTWVPPGSETLMKRALDEVLR